MHTIHQGYSGRTKPLVQKIQQDLDLLCKIAITLLLPVDFEGWPPIPETILRHYGKIINYVKKMESEKKFGFLTRNVQAALIFMLSQGSHKL